jgi:hypothetical protein
VEESSVVENVEEKDPLQYFSEMENDWKRPPKGGFFYLRPTWWPTHFGTPFIKD